MMIEMKHVRQIRGEGFRRWFTDDYFDLYMWYDHDKNEEPNGFQLCYGKIDTDHALTWKKDHGFTHDGVDTGDYNPSEHRTPILVKDGLFPKTKIVKEFDHRSEKIDPVVRKFVLKKLKEF